MNTKNDDYAAEEFVDKMRTALARRNREAAARLAEHRRTALRSTVIRFRLSDIVTPMPWPSVTMFAGKF